MLDRGLKRPIEDLQTRCHPLSLPSFLIPSVSFRSRFTTALTLLLPASQPLSILLSLLSLSLRPCLSSLSVYKGERFNEMTECVVGASRKVWWNRSKQWKRKLEDEKGWFWRMLLVLSGLIFGEWSYFVLSRAIVQCAQCEIRRNSRVSGNCILVTRKRSVTCWYSKRFILTKITILLIILISIPEIITWINHSISMISKSKSKKEGKKKRINATKISYFGFKNLLKIERCMKKEKKRLSTKRWDQFF